MTKGAGVYPNMTHEQNSRGNSGYEKNYWRAAGGKKMESNIQWYSPPNATESDMRMTPVWNQLTSLFVLFTIVKIG